MRCYAPPSQTFVTVEISSAYFNVINFVLFDILLASIVFFLTADIAGLVNAASALQQLGNRLHAYNPPLVGVGLTCTRRNVFRVLALTRAIAMLAVLATNFLVEGVSCERIRNLEQDVVVPGRIGKDVLQVDVRRFTLRRRGCQGRAKNEVFYGELRLGKRCELRPPLMSTQTVYFGLKFDQREIVFPKTECKFFTDDSAYTHIHQYECPGLGTIGCLINRENASMPDTCEGIIMANDSRINKPGKVGYLCKGEALFPGRFGLKRNKTVARCRMAENINVTDTSWVPLLHNKVRTLRDAVDAVYGAKIEKKMVKVTDANDRMEVAQVEKAWFGILGAKFLLIVVLVAIDLWMRARGLVPAANNEFGLGSLLAQSSANISSPFGLDDTPDSPADEVRVGEKPHLFIQNENGVLRARNILRKSELGG